MNLRANPVVGTEQIEYDIVVSLILAVWLSRPVCTHVIRKHGNPGRLRGISVCSVPIVVYGLMIHTL